ncbi:hypothetical protein FH972_019621 [Carpinus fangiana]|uniref:Uncharacterized protein n=1 Tax=Carpinus fangiana TaxID=176857 RepID=A0A5N6RR05_9ROSI|nr:hypothetical protein FH972_019621 [Carpinus fangiana]
MDVHSSCKNPPMSSSCVNGTAVEKPRLVFKLKLSPAHNKEKKPCKVIKDREDENYTKATITISPRDPAIKPRRQPR